MLAALVVTVLACLALAYAMRTPVAPTPAVVGPRHAGAAHPTDAPRTTRGKHAASPRHAAPATPAPAMTTVTTSGRYRSLHTNRLVSAYVASVLDRELPRECTVPPVPRMAAPTIVRGVKRAPLPRRQLNRAMPSRSLVA